MKRKERIVEVLKNKNFPDFDVESKELWLRAKIVMQFITLREKSGLKQSDVAKRMNITRQMIAKFESMTNSPTITFLVKYANALGTEVDVLVKGVGLVEIINAK
ncbi:MAG: helix-turn-helix transcriptional regulator [Lutibacter sp.]|jgi:DNA-binding XRE family transcriptional regulator